MRLQGRNTASISEEHVNPLVQASTSMDISNQTIEDNLESIPENLIKTLKKIQDILLLKMIKSEQNIDAYQNINWIINHINTNIEESKYNQNHNQ